VYIIYILFILTDSFINYILSTYFVKINKLLCHFIMNNVRHKIFNKIYYYNIYISIIIKIYILVIN